MLAFRDIQCPWCGESIDIAVDPSIADQQYTEDCQVCCRPILLTVHVDEDGDVRIGVRRENEA